VKFQDGTSYNFCSLLNLPSIIREFGPLHLWEGGGMSEKNLRCMKKDWNGLRCNWQRKRMAKVYTKLAVMRMNYKAKKAIASWYDNDSDDEGNNTEDGENNLQNTIMSCILRATKILKRYKDTSEVQQQLQKALPVSILKHKDTYCFCL
jgi:hypothetical protein